MNRSLLKCYPTKKLKGTIGSGLKREEVAVKQRNFSISAKMLNERGQKPTAKVVYVQSPFTWLDNKFKFYALKTRWDPNFDLNEFQYGTRQAISTVTTLISTGDYSSLHGLLSKKAIEKVQQEVQLWNSSKQSGIGLSFDDICVNSVRKVDLQVIVDHLHCDIDVALVGIKRLSGNTRDGKDVQFLILELIARFHREYTRGVLPEWTITNLTFKKCDTVS